MANCLKLTLITVLIVFSNNIGYAKDIWIHATGIDTENLEQNSSGFYKDADDFLDTCRRSKRNPECILFINTNKAHTSNEDAITKRVKEKSKGPFKSSTILAALTAAVANANPPDQIVLSMTNHGAPSLDSSRPGACVYSGKDKICSYELENILRQLKPGVQVLINANACYSGSFADLGKIAGVCTATASGTFSVGDGASSGLWQSIKKTDDFKLQSTMLPLGAETNPRLSSQTIMRHLCEDGRKNLETKKEIFQGIGKLRHLNFADNVCRDNRNSQLNGLSHDDQVGLVDDLKKLANYGQTNCMQDGFPNVACSAAKNLGNATGRFHFMFKKFQQDENAYLESLRKREELVKTRYSSNVKYFGHFVDWILNGTHTVESFNWLPKKDFAELKRAISELTPAAKALDAEKDQLYTRYQESLAEIKKDPNYENLIAVESCFLSAQHASTPLIGGTNTSSWDSLAENQRSKLRKFTEADYRKEKECESQIRF